MILWTLCGFAVMPFLLIKYALSHKNLGKILIFPQSKIGDFIAQAPVFREIKNTYPDSFITVILINPVLKDLLKANPYVNEVLTYDINSGIVEKLKLIFKLALSNYDWCLNLTVLSWIDFFALYSLIPGRLGIYPSKHYLVTDILAMVFFTKYYKYPRGAYSTEFYINMLHPIGISSKNFDREIHTDTSDRSFAVKLLKKYVNDKNRKIIVISCSCGNKLKTWPEKYFAEISDRLMENYNAYVFFTGSIEDKSITERVTSLMKNKPFDVSGSMSLGQFAAFCEKIDLFISVDSGPLYIACAAGTPVIDIAGPCNILEQFKPSQIHRFIQLDLPCIPCSFVMPHATECRTGTTECINNILPEMIMQTAGDILKQ